MCVRYLIAIYLFVYALFVPTNMCNNFVQVICIAVNMDRNKCGTFSSFRWLSPDIYHINILKNPNEVDIHWGRSAKPKYTYL